MSEKKLVGVGGPEPLQSMNERELWNAIDRRGEGGGGQAFGKAAKWPWF